MKCQKCSFISFDYLAECKKCGVDLAAVRDGLGLLDLKPSLPFYLEPLLKATQASPSPELGAGIGPLPSLVGQTGEKAEAPLDFGVLDDELTIELSDDELSHLIDAPESADERTAVTEVGRTSDEFDTEIQIGDDLGIEFADEGTDDTTAQKTEATTAAINSKAAGEATEDDLVLDLKEGDLGGLLLELEEEPKDKK